MLVGGVEEEDLPGQFLAIVCFGCFVSDACTSFFLGLTGEILLFV